jgi:hypothetical protein
MGKILRLLYFEKIRNSDCRQLKVILIIAFGILIFGIDYTIEV